jgi:S1-C subfamily serine protease
MTKYLAACVASILFFACGIALAEDAPSAPQPSLKLSTVLMAIPVGTPWYTVSFGLACLNTDGVMRATGGREPQSLPPYTAVFNAEVEKAGFKSVAKDDLFNREDTGAADYLVGAVITDANIRACASRGGLLGPGKLGDARGSGTMKIEWQVYSPLRNDVVARVTTNASVNVEKTVPDGMTRLVVSGFANNLDQLLASPEFRTAMNNKTPTVGDVLKTTSQYGKIALAGSQKAVKRPVADAVGSVVTLETSSVSGSGVLLSDDGYILTNAHVVGEEKELRVRWSDGIEMPGTVVRVSKPRDVALIQTNPRGRLPPPILRGAVTPGQRVYAIGSPNGAKFAGTVSSGVVSASRTINGFNFIQSDVSVSPGSSGGALLDETGSLLGITEGGFDNEGKTAGLNIFIPIGDAMDFLNLEQN